MKYDEIVCVIDRSGSMSSIEEETIKNFNMFLKGQKKLKKPAKMSIVLFDDEYIIKHWREDIKKVPRFTHKTYVPRNTTALLDAIGKTINKMDKSIMKKKKTNRPDNVVFCILTDGFENASKEYTRQQIFDLIKKQKDKREWTFVFLAANQDAIAEGGTMGFSSSDCSNFTCTDTGVYAAWCACGSNVSVVRGYSSDAWR